MATTAMRARMNSRGDKSTLLGDAGKGGGSGAMTMVGECSMNVKDMEIVVFDFYCLAKRVSLAGGV